MSENKEIILVDKNLLANEKTTFCKYTSKKITEIEALPTKKKEIVVGQEKTTQLVKSWYWLQDEQESMKRDYFLPVEMLSYLQHTGLARDIMAVLMSKWFEDKPADGEIKTSYYEIFKKLGFSDGGGNQERVEEALRFLFFLRIENQKVIEELCQKTGVVKKKSNVTFGYVDGIKRTIMDDGKEIPKNKQPLIIHRNKYVVDGLKLCIPASVLEEMIQKIAKVSPKNTRAMRNFLYYFTGKQVGKEKTIRISFETLRKESEYTEKRKSRLLPKINKCLDFLVPNVIKEYSWQTNREGKNVVDIKLLPVPTKQIESPISQ